MTIQIHGPFVCAFCGIGAQSPFDHWPFWAVLICRKTGIKTHLCSLPCLANHTAALAGDPITMPGV